jgi:hypothetical protein
MKCYIQWLKKTHWLPLWFFCSQRPILSGFLIFRFWAYLNTIILETLSVQKIRYLRFYLEPMNRQLVNMRVLVRVYGPLQSSSVLLFVHFVFVYIICVFLYAIVFRIMKIKDIFIYMCVCIHTTHTGPSVGFHAKWKWHSNIKHSFIPPPWRKLCVWFTLLCRKDCGGSIDSYQNPHVN